MSQTSAHLQSLAPRECLVHATCIAIDGRGVLLRGPSGAGKSDLALRLIGGPVCTRTEDGDLAWKAGAELVADDQVIIWPRNGRLMARAPATIAGKIEVRGLGIVEFRHKPETTIALVVDLVSKSMVERMPTSGQAIEINNVLVLQLALDPFEASARSSWLSHSRTCNHGADERGKICILCQVRRLGYCVAGRRTPNMCDCGEEREMHAVVIRAEVLIGAACAVVICWRVPNWRFFQVYLVSRP